MFGILEEGNFANSGSFKVTVEKGEMDETLHSMDDILAHIIKHNIEKTVTSAHKETIVTYFKSNFFNWLKNDAPGYEQYGARWPQKDIFYEAAYPKTKDVIAGLEYESQQLGPKSQMTFDEILALFPPFVQKSIDNSVIFFGGRRLKFERIGGNNIISEMADYINAVLNDAREIREANLGFNNASKVPVPEMMRRCHTYHEYLKRLKTELSNADAKKMFIDGGLKPGPGNDYILIQKIDGLEFRNVISQKYIQYEGIAVHHCVGSHWNDVQSGTETIISVVDTVNAKRSIGTIALRGRWTPGQKTSTVQIKGFQNQAVQAEYHNAFWKFFIEQKINVEGDKWSIGNQPSKDVIQFFKDKEANKAKD